MPISISYISQFHPPNQAKLYDSKLTNENQMVKKLQSLGMKGKEIQSNINYYCVARVYCYFSQCKTSVQCSSNIHQD